MSSKQESELISGPSAVSHFGKFSRINVAFVHAELSFCAGSRFCLSFWRWCYARSNSSCCTVLWNSEAIREEEHGIGSGPVVQVQVFAHPNTALISWQAEWRHLLHVLGFQVVSFCITHKNRSLCS